MVDDDHTAPWPLADRRRQFDRADGGEHLHPITIADAERGGVVGMHDHLVSPSGRMQAGQLVEPRVHRMTIAPVRQLERIVRRCLWSRLGEEFAGPLHELRWRRVHLLVVGSERFLEVSELPWTQHPAMLVGHDVAPFDPAAVDLPPGSHDEPVDPVRPELERGSAR